MLPSASCTKAGSETFPKPSDFAVTVDTNPYVSATSDVDDELEPPLAVDPVDPLVDPLVEPVDAALLHFATWAVCFAVHFLAAIIAFAAFEPTDLSRQAFVTGSTGVAETLLVNKSEPTSPTTHKIENERFIIPPLTR